MADKRVHYDTSKLTMNQMGQVVDEMVTSSQNTRRSYERRWYDNNFFDDGHHFRYLSRSQNKIIDLSERSNIYSPMRAIPKASVQIRGISNLLTSRDLTPVVFPERINKAAYEDEREFLLAKEVAKQTAKLQGHWLQEEFKKQELLHQISHMILLSCKHGISYMQIWPDAVDEKIRTQVYDAFDVYVMGDLTDLQDSPFVVKAIPQLISEIKANENFDEEQLKKINPDNRHASSEIKESYMHARYGREFKSDQTATLILKEAYIKEYLNDDNKKRIKSQEDGEDILRDKEEGDVVIRQTFTAGNITLKDGYISGHRYPFIEYRLWPGNLYQTPQIERFMSSNKSLDTVVSRLERYVNTMVVGTWLKRQGEQVNISNQAGGQIIEYKSTPPVQGQMASIPNFLFNYINLLNSFIEEQGVTTTALGKIPAGVESGKAIESLKESEFANLIIPERRLRKAIRDIAKTFLEIADEYFVTPQEITLLEKGEPTYFDVIGKQALKRRRDLKISTPDEIVALDKEAKVEIEVQSGIGFTREGRKVAMQQLIQELRAYAAEGYIPPQAIAVAIQEYLKAYEFGATDEFMQEMDKSEGQANLSQQQIDAMKVAMAEVIQDTGIADRPDTTDEDIDKTKVAVAETLQDLQGGGGGGAT